MTMRSERVQNATIMAGLLILGALTVWFTRVSWSIPSPDFFDFERVVLAFQTGEWPESFKRAPVFPGLIFLVQHLGLSTFDSAQLIGAIGIGLVAMLAFWGLRAHFSLASSLVAAILIAGYPELIGAAHGGLLEPVLMVGIVGWMASAARKQVYAAAFFAALAGATRAEGLVLCLLTFALVWDWDLRSALRGTLLTLAALGPGTAWIVLGKTHTDNLSPYVGETGALGNAGAKFLLMAGLGPVRSPDWHPLQLWETSPWLYGLLAGLVILAMVAGLVMLGRRSWLLTSCLSVWLLAYGAIHTWFTAAHMRYVIPLIPVVAWAFVALLSPLPALTDDEEGAWRWESAYPYLRGLGYVVGSLALLGLMLSGIQLALWGCLVACCALAFVFRQPAWFGVPLCLAAGWGYLMTTRALHKTTGSLWAEAKPTADWIRENLQEDEKIIVYYGAIPWFERAGIPSDQLVPDYNLKSAEHFDKVDARWAIWTSTILTLYDGPDEWQQRADRAIYRMTPPLQYLKWLKESRIPGWQEVARIQAGPRLSIIYRQFMTREERRLWSNGLAMTAKVLPFVFSNDLISYRNHEDLFSPMINTTP